MESFLATACIQSNSRPHLSSCLLAGFENRGSRNNLIPLLVRLRPSSDLLELEEREVCIAIVLRKPVRRRNGVDRDNYL
jgi:hypothetical protein